MAEMEAGSLEDDMVRRNERKWVKWEWEEDVDEEWVILEGVKQGARNWRRALKERRLSSELKESAGQGP